MPSLNYNQDLGKSGEDRAASLLEKAGFRILARNFRFGRAGEIDIIALKDNILLFVEVKSRRTGQYGGALYSISNKKKLTLRRTAQHFLQQNSRYNTTDYICRFDMISFENDDARWIEDIIR